MEKQTTRKFTPYHERDAFKFMNQIIDNALHDCRVVSVALHDAQWTLIQKATVGIIPIGMSIVCSIRELVRMGYIPSAKILVRPLIERVALADYIAKNDAAAVDWNNGWLNKNKRLSFAQLLSILEKGHKEDWEIYQKFMVDDFNSVIHPDPKGDETFLSENENGQSVYWLETVPSAFALADNICAASSMAATFLASHAKRAFVYKKKGLT